MNSMIEERKIHDAWKVVDQAVRLVARTRDVLSPLHCDIRLAGIQRSLESRSASPYFVVGIEASTEHRVWSASVKRTESQAPAALRPGVLVLPLSNEVGCESKGNMRLTCDAIHCGADTAAWLCNTDRSVIAPGLLGDLLDSVLDFPIGVDRALAAYGSLREAFHAVKEVEQIARAEMDAIDRALAPAEPIDAPLDSGPADSDLDYLHKLDDLLSEQIQRERDLGRDREQLARKYKLQSIGLTEPLLAADLSDREDERRKSLLNVVFGKAIIFVTLRDEAINRLVERVEEIALTEVRKKVERIGRGIEKLGSGRMQRVLGLRVATSAEIEAATEVARRRRIQESIGVAGREFQFKIERLGALNRLMRARMEVAGLLMVVSLAFAAFGDANSVNRIALLQITLSVAVVLTVWSYLSAKSIEREKRDDELIRLRGLLRKPVSEAIGRAYVDAMGLVVQQLEAVRSEIKRRIGIAQEKRQARAASDAPPVLVMLAARRAQIARALGGMGGISAVEAQLSAQLAPGSPIRTAIDPYLKAGHG